MSKKSIKKHETKDIEEIAHLAEQGEDVSQHFAGKFVAKQRVNVDFSLELLQMIDEECQRLGVTRQAWIKMACDKRLRQIQIGRNSYKKASA